MLSPSLRIELSTVTRAMMHQPLTVNAPQNKLEKEVLTKRQIKSNRNVSKPT